MGMRKGVPHAKCSPLCAIKEKLQELWDRAYGCINKINDITPDGDGKFSIQAGSNIQLTEISNGLKIDTTGGVTYYTAGDTYIDVDNDDLEISLVNPGQTGGVALHDDLEVVAQSVVDVVNGTTQVGDAAHANSATTAGSATEAGSKITVTDSITTVTNGITRTTNSITIPAGKTGIIMIRCNTAPGSASSLITLGEFNGSSHMSWLETVNTGSDTRFIATAIERATTAIDYHAGVYSTVGSIDITVEMVAVIL